MDPALAGTHHLCWIRLGTCPQQVRLHVRPDQLSLRTALRTLHKDKGDYQCLLAPVYSCSGRLFALNSCRFDGSHLAVQVDAAHKTDNRQLYNLLPDRGLEKGTQKMLKIAQDNYTSSSGTSEVKLEKLPVDSFGNFSCACLLHCSLMIFKSVGSIPDIDPDFFFRPLS